MQASATAAVSTSRWRSHAMRLPNASTIAKVQHQSHRTVSASALALQSCIDQNFVAPVTCQSILVTSMFPASLIKTRPSCKRRLAHESCICRPNIDKGGLMLASWPYTTGYQSSELGPHELIDFVFTTWRD